MRDEAQELHRDAIIIDGLFFKIGTPIPPTEEVPDLMVGHLLASGVTAFNHSVIDDINPLSAEEALMRVHRDSIIFETFRDHLMPIQNTEDIRAAKRDGKVGIIFGTQGLASIGTNMRYIWIYYKLGVRIMQLTYNERNALGSGCMEPNDTGLTRFGQQAIAEMNRLGVLIDLSHCGHDTSLQAIAHSTKPVAFTHVGVKALRDHPRNISDDQIRAAAESGGIIGLCPHSIFVEKERGKRPTVDDYIDHIDYVVNLVGIDHVGIGTDNFQYDTFYHHLMRAQFERTFPTFFGGYGIHEKHAEGFSRWSDWPKLTASLLRRGYEKEHVKKILGDNFMRVFQATWA